METRLDVSRRRSVSGEQMMRHGPYRAPQHRTNKQGRPKNTTRVVRSITGGDSDKLQYHQQRHQLECHASVQRLADIAITNTQNLRHKPAHQSDRQTADHGLEPDRLLREAAVRERETSGITDSS